MVRNLVEVMINYGWSPCQEGVKEPPLFTITPRVPVFLLLCGGPVAQGEETGSCPQPWCVLGSAQGWMGVSAGLWVSCNTLWCPRGALHSLLPCRAGHQQLAVGTGTSITTSSPWQWGHRRFFQLGVPIRAAQGATLSSLLPR